VSDNEEESTIWENDFLQEATVGAFHIIGNKCANLDHQLAPLLLEKTLLLRLQAGSQEAGFLAAIYPIPKTPTLVIIQ
jgi:hypothetical protein